MKLVCFPNNTAGGLVCNLLNNKSPIFDGYKTVNVDHSIFKSGDTSSITDKIDNLPEWYNKTKKYKNSNLWYGTHTHPSGIPNLHDFDEVLLITTINTKSKLYRWLRYYYGWYFSVSPNWTEDDTLEKIDKIRELCKNVFIDFSPFKDYECIEFENIVNGNFINDRKLSTLDYENWKANNLYLYNSKYNEWGVKRFYEAKYELETGEPFKYI